MLAKKPAICATPDHQQEMYPPKLNFSVIRQRVSLEPRPLISSRITATDIALIDQIFKLQTHSNPRRCQAAWINRLRRIAESFAISDNDLVIFDFDWDLANLNDLWNRVSLTTPKKAWKTDCKTSWDFLNQYVYRADIAEDVVIRASEPQASGLNWNIKFEPTTGYRIRVLNREALESNFVELLAACSAWFSHAVVIFEDCVWVTQFERRRLTLQNDLQAPLHENKIRINRDRIERAIHDTESGLDTRSMTIYSYRLLPNKMVEARFIPFDEAPQQTMSGTLLIAHRDSLGGTRLFLINTHSWLASYQGPWLNTKPQSDVIAAHYRHLRAVALLGGEA